MRRLLSTVINALLSAEADAVCGAEWGQPSAERVNQRNGYRHRELDTRVGTVDVAVPKLRQGSYFPEWLLERRKRAESALIKVVATCYLLGRPRWPGRIRVPNSLREMANCDRNHVGVTDRVLPAVGVSGLWGKCPPKSPEERPICVT
jgi:Transposase, Mutator family